MVVENNDADIGFAQARRGCERGGVQNLREQTHGKPIVSQLGRVATLDSCRCERRDGRLGKATTKQQDATNSEKEGRVVMMERREVWFVERLLWW